MPIRKAEAKSASDAASSGGVIEELRRRYDRLTQSQKRIAEYIVEHSQAVAFSTVDQMAAQLDVNPSTIVRFTYRLGLNGFPDLQERMRELVRGQLSRTGDPINEGQVAGHLEGTSFGASLSHDWQNLHRTISGLDAAAFGRAVNILVARVASTWPPGSRPFRSRIISRWCSIVCAARFRCSRPMTRSRPPGWSR